MNMITNEVYFTHMQLQFCSKSRETFSSHRHTQALIHKRTVGEKKKKKSAQTSQHQDYMSL